MTKLLSGLRHRANLVATGTLGTSLSLVPGNGRVMPIKGAVAPSPKLEGAGHALFQALPSSGPTALAFDPLRRQLLVAAGAKLLLISWTTQQSVLAGTTHP